MAKKSKDEFNDNDTISDDEEVLREWIDWQASLSDTPHSYEDLLAEADDVDIVEAFDYGVHHYDSLFDEPEVKRPRGSK